MQRVLRGTEHRSRLCGYCRQIKKYDLKAFGCNSARVFLCIQQFQSSVSMTTRRRKTEKAQRLLYMR